MRRPGAALLAAALSFAAAAAEISQKELQAQRHAGAPVYVLDVRTPEEFAAGHVPGAVNIPLAALAGRMAAVPRDRTVVVYCESGGRARRAEKLLADSGRDVRHLEGDMSAWRAAQLGIER